MLNVVKIARALQVSPVQAMAAIGNVSRNIARNVVKTFIFIRAFIAALSVRFFPGTVPGDFLTFLHRFLPGARNEERPLALQQEPLSRPMPRALRCFPRQVIYEL